MIQGQQRIDVDRMWRNPKIRREFEKCSGFSDDNARIYQDGFVRWAINRLNLTTDIMESCAKIADSVADSICDQNNKVENWCAGKRYGALEVASNIRALVASDKITHG